MYFFLHLFLNLFDWKEHVDYRTTSNELIYVDIMMPAIVFGINFHIFLLQLYYIHYNDYSWKEQGTPSSHGSHFTFLNLFYIL